GGRGGGGSGEETITVSALTEHFDEALAIMSDALLHPAFPADELERWKGRQRSALEQMRTQPAALSSETLMRVLYPNDARRSTRLTTDSLAKITREQIVEHYKRYYVPSGELAGISGDISAANAVAKLERALGGW